jgi:hypothetical protein
VDDKKGLFRLMSSASIVVVITSRRIAGRRSEVTMVQTMALHEKPVRPSKHSAPSLRHWRILG